MIVDVGAATLVLASATVLLAFFTRRHVEQTQRLVSEMQKDRRRQFLENALEKAYSPLFESFRRAHIEIIRPRTASGFTFTIEEIGNIRLIVERYGHYDPPLFNKIRVTILDRPGKLEWQLAEMDGLYEKIMNEHQRLSAELGKLVGIA
jgi:hypothetical protein